MAFGAVWYAGGLAASAARRLNSGPLGGEGIVVAEAAQVIGGGP